MADSKGLRIARLEKLFRPRIREAHLNSRMNYITSIYSGK